MSIEADLQLLAAAARASKAARTCGCRCERYHYCERCLPLSMREGGEFAPERVRLAKTRITEAIGVREIHVDV